MNIDRRDIAPFLLRWFPDMVNATSDDWHFFLDSVCFVDTPIDIPNGQAFDRWREKLEGIGYPVMKHSPNAVAALKAKAETMAAAEKVRAASQSETLKALAKEAPNWPFAEVLASMRGKAK